MTPEILHSLITVIGAIAVNVLILAGAWLKFRTEIRRQAAEIKQHTDISVTRLNGMLRYVISSMDRPCWVKLAKQENGRTVFRMLEVNDPYFDAFGLSRTDYIGKTDLEAGWDHQTAAKFYDHDLMVWASGEPQTFVEIIRGRPMRFRKVRVMSESGTAKGIMGYAVDCSDPHRCPIYSEGGCLPPAEDAPAE